MNKIAALILFPVLFTSCDSNGDEKHTVNKQDSIPKKIKIHRIPEELFLYHFKILDSAAKMPMKDTMYNCCWNSVNFMEEYTGIEADVDGDYAGATGFKKGDLRKWHEWYDKEYGK
jgi:hypothetical protein